MSGRIRTIKPEWLEDEKLVLASPAARTLSVALMVIADDQGNGRLVPAVMAARIFPGEPGFFPGAFDELHRLRFVMVYICEGQTYWSIRNWNKHQRVDKPAKPRIPGPLDSGVTISQDFSLGNSASSRLTPTPTPTPTRTTDQDPIPKKRKQQTKTPSAPAAEQPGYAELVALWFDGYRSIYGKSPVWGPVQGKQLKAIIDKSNIEELLQLVPMFFKWNRAEVIKAGHSLSTGYASFAMKLDELRADVLNAGRRKQAAIAQDTERTDERAAAKVGQLDRVVASITGSANGKPNRNGSSSQSGGNFRPGETGTAHGRDGEPQDLGRSPRILDSGTLAALRRAHAPSAGLGSEAEVHAERDRDSGEGD